jgi:Outer membrane protein beta-barrel domain
MFCRSLIIPFAIAMFTVGTTAQDIRRWNFNVGGGVGFPQSSTADFANVGGHFVLGVGPNLGPLFGVSGELMWHDLPIKREAIDRIGVPDAGARQYSLTANGILRLPLRGSLGAYVIAGGGWYRRSGELTAPTFVPGTICPPFWVWWGVCVSGLFPPDAVLASSSSNAFGGNIGGGFTYHIGEGNMKFYTEIRYHHAAHNKVDTDLLPLTFGLRW